MIVDPDFFDHWKTVVLVEELEGDPAAPLYILRLWAHCQNRRQWVFGSLTPKAIRALCRFRGDAQELIDALVAASYLDVDDNGVMTVQGWDEYNSQLIANWTNGKKGGRPKKPIANPRETHPKAKAETGKSQTPGQVVESPAPKPGTAATASQDGEQTEEIAPAGTQRKPIANPQGTQRKPIGLDRTGSDKTNSGRAAKSPNYPDWFEDFWKAYPANDSGRKRGKAKSYKLAHQVPADDRADLIKAAEAYSQEANGYVRDPERFIRDEFWRDYVVERERPAHLARPKVSPAMDVESMRFKLVKAGHRAARDWDSETVQKQYRKMVSKPKQSAIGGMVKVKTVGASR